VMLGRVILLVIDADDDGAQLHRHAKNR
jgi:hypothetical protein